MRTFQRGYSLIAVFSFFDGLKVQKILGKWVLDTYENSMSTLSLDVYKQRTKSYLGQKGRRLRAKLKPKEKA